MPLNQSPDFITVENNLSKINHLIFSGQDANQELFELFAETNHMREEMGHSREYRRVSDALLKQLISLEDIVTNTEA